MTSASVMICHYLGLKVTALMRDAPFDAWKFERSVEKDLGELIVHYVFPNHGLELRCDRDERISVIFLYFDAYGGFDDSLIEARFTWTCQEVRGRYGTPSKSGDKSSHPILGEYGAWDRFTLPECTVRFEYLANNDGIKKITFMRNDVVP